MAVLESDYSSNEVVHDGAEDTSFLDPWSSSATALDEVMAHVQALERLQAEVENAETRLSELKVQKAHLESDIIPTYMLSHGLDELKLSNGKRLSIKEDVFCRLPEDAVKRAEALAWLEENGGAEKIKDEAVIEDIDASTLDELDKLGVPYSRKRTVNTNALTAWFREVVGLKKGSVARLDVADVPATFGLFIKRTAKLG